MTAIKGWIMLQLEVLNRSRDENAELASRVFELSQTLGQKWLTAEYEEKRQILEIVWLNCRLDDVTLVPTIRKPFDVLAEGPLVPDSGREGIRMKVIPFDRMSQFTTDWRHVKGQQRPPSISRLRRSRDGRCPYGKPRGNLA